MKTYYAIIKDGKLAVKGARISFNDYIRLNYKEGEKIVLTIKKYKKPHSDKQRRYYWGGVLETIVEAVSETTGHTKDDLHALFKDMFLSRKKILWRGVQRELTPSTKTLDITEFSDYVNMVIVEAAQLGVKIQTPDEYYNS